MFKFPVLVKSKMKFTNETETAIRTSRSIWNFLSSLVTDMLRSIVDTAAREYIIQMLLAPKTLLK